MWATRRNKALYKKKSTQKAIQMVNSVSDDVRFKFFPWFSVHLIYPTYFFLFNLPVTGQVSVAAKTLICNQ
jgi:hypothetical protein